jgi:hypothetical protein
LDLAELLLGLFFVFGAVISFCGLGRSFATIKLQIQNQGLFLLTHLPYMAATV